MEAEDIIQQKEWHQLNAGELHIIKDLADTEQEYNLLKKMLQLSGDEAYAVPPVSPHVKAALDRQLAAKKVIPLNRYWYAAAAAVLIFAGIVFFNKKDTAETMLKDTMAGNLPVPVQPTQPLAIITDTVTAIKKETPLAVQKKHTQPTIIPVPTPAGNDTALQDAALAFNNKVGEQKALLNLVTEIY